jgi:arginyl-tRNA synthetase
MLLAYMQENPEAAESRLADLEGFYRAAKRPSTTLPSSPSVPAGEWCSCRLAMQECLRLWHQQRYFLSQALYDRLGCGN